MKHWNITIAAFAAALLAGCSDRQEEIPPPLPRPVRYAEAEGVGGERVRIFAGTARAGMESRLSFRVGGSLTQLKADVGDNIRKGSLIAELDSSDYQLQVERARASLEQANAQLANFEADFRRVRGLYERDNASQDDFDAAQAAVDSGRANVRSIEKQIEQAQSQVSYCKLYAPVGGRVAEVPVEVNENVRAGQPIVELNVYSTPEVEVGVPEILIGEIRRGVVVRRITFSALPGEEFQGVVGEVAPAATEGLTTYPVRIRLTGGSRGVLPGMAAEVELRVGSGGERVRILVPPNSVGEDRQGRFVWTLTPGSEGRGTVARQEVQVGGLVGTGASSSAVEILEGVNEGDLVVTAGIGRLAEGQEVRVRKEDRL